MAARDQRRKFFLTGCAVLIVATAWRGSSVHAAEQAAQKPAAGPPSAKEQVEKLLVEYNEGFEKIRQDMLQTMTADEVSDTIMSVGPLERLGYLGPRFLALASENPKTDVSWKALRWVVYIRGFSADDKDAALRQMLRDHITDDEFYNDLPDHLYRPGVDHERFFREVLKCPDAPRRVAGMARFALAKWLVLARKGAEAEAV